MEQTSLSRRPKGQNSALAAGLRLVASPHAKRASITLTLAQAEAIQANERRRIASDLHDDLGAKLLTIVHANDAVRMAELAREALDDMRLIVGHLDGKPMHLSDAIADWRSEFVRRLDDVGIAARWDVAGPVEPFRMSARIYMQVTRILREAVNNVVKHSRAAHCRVECSLKDAGMLVLELVDDGRGLPVSVRAGHGLASMQARAAEAGGFCAIEPAPLGGVAVKLFVRLRRA